MNDSVEECCSLSHTANPSADQQTLLDALRFNANHRPEALVYRIEGHGEGESEDLSNADLARIVSRYARAIKGMATEGESDPTRILLVLPQGRSFVGAYFGCIAAQAIAVPTFPPKNQRQAERLKLMLLDLGQCVVLTTQEALHTDLAELRRDPDLGHIRWAISEDVERESSCSLDEFHADPSAIAMLQYTSGSTGRPRGVMVTNQNLWANSELIKQSFAHDRPNRRSVIWLPPYHDMGLIGGVLQPVHAGFAALLMPTSLFVRHPFRWLKAIDDFRGTSSGGPNFAFQLCVNNVRERDLARLDLSSWDIAFCGAEPINHQTMIDFCKRFSRTGFRPSAIYPCYGMAETTLMVSGKHPFEDFKALPVEVQSLAKGHVSVSDANSPRTHTLVSCGTVHSSLDARIVDPEMSTELSECEIGEVWVSGSSVAAGYWKDDKKTEQTFGQRLPNSQSRFLRTGDLGFIHQGELYVTGRLKEVLIVRGANYYPQDLEHECTAACPEVTHIRAAAFSVPGTGQEKVVLIVETPRPNLDHDDLAKRINTRLIEKFGIKSDVIAFVPRHTIRTTTSGKVQRSTLRDAYLANTIKSYRLWEEMPERRSANAPTVALDTSSERTIVDWIIDKVASITELKHDQIRSSDTFTELALDSVASLEMLSELDQKHGIGISPESLYKFNTPDLLAREIYNTVQGMRPMGKEIEHAAC